MTGLIARKHAKKQGLKYYFTGKPCSNGHVGLRYVSVGRCVECAKRYYETYKEQHPELYRAAFEKYRARNKDEINARARSRYALDSETHLARKREWKRRNKERMAEYFAQWYEQNKDKNAFNSRTYEARKRKAIPAWCDLGAVEAIYRRCHQINEATGVKHEVDHIVPLCSDIVCGLHVPENLRIITQEANRSKRNLHWPDMP